MLDHAVLPKNSTTRGWTGISAETLRACFQALCHNKTEIALAVAFIAATEAPNGRNNAAETAGAAYKTYTSAQASLR
jgi:hypothetical protein